MAIDIPNKYSDAFDKNFFICLITAYLLQLL